MKQINSLILMITLAVVYLLTGCKGEENIYPKVHPENNPEYELLAHVTGVGDEKSEFFEVSSGEVVILYKVKYHGHGHTTHNMEIFLGTGIEDIWEDPIIDVFNYKKKDSHGDGHGDEHAEESDTHLNEDQGEIELKKEDKGHYEAGENIPAPVDKSKGGFDNPDLIGEKMLKFVEPDTYLLFIESTDIEYDIKVFQKIED